MNRTSDDVLVICAADDGLNGIITSILGQGCFILVSALNQHSIFNLIEQFHPLAVIADSGLSGIMGYKPWEIVKGIERFKDTKIVLVSAESAQDDICKTMNIDVVIDRESLSASLLSTVSEFSSLTDQVQINEDARRLARAIVSDIVHYNMDAACRSAADGTFYDVLGKEIEKGMAVYQQRISLETPGLPDYFNEAIREFITKTQQSNLVLP